MKNETATENNQPLASEIIAEISSNLNNINDLLEKGIFAITELIDIVSDELCTEDDIRLFAFNQEKINMYAHIAFDYLLQAKNSIDVKEQK